MNVLVIFGGKTDYPGGAEIATIRLVGQLKEKFSFIAVVDPELDRIVSYLENSEIALSTAPVRKNIVASVRHVNKLVKTANITVLHVIDARGHMIGWLAKLLNPGVKLIRVKHDLFPDSLRYVKKLLLKAFELLSQIGTDKYIAVSNYTKQELIRDKIKRAKITRIYNGLELPSDQSLSSNASPSDPYILFLGRKEANKGIETALKVFEIVNEQIPVRMIMAGPGKVNNLPKDNLDKLTLVEWVDDPEELLKNAYMLIMPSIKEGFGLSGLEAFSYGKPVIAVSGSGLSELIEHGVNGLLSSNEPILLAAAVIRLINDKKLYLSLSQGAIETSKKFDIRFTAEQYKAVYEALQ